MLYTVGPLRIEVWPFNVDKVSGEVSGAFVEKAVLGRRPPLEDVGEGPETLELTGSLFPFKLGGLSELELAKALARSRQTVSVMRGDGLWRGFFVLEKVADAEEYLHANGVGQVIKHTLSLKRADAPFAADFFDSLMGFFS